MFPLCRKKKKWSRMHVLENNWDRVRAWHARPPLKKWNIIINQSIIHHTVPRLSFSVGFSHRLTGYSSYRRLARDEMRSPRPNRASVNIYYRSKIIIEKFKAQFCLCSGCKPRTFKAQIVNTFLQIRLDDSSSKGYTYQELWQQYHFVISPNR